jgi:hypothetical protein
MAPAAGLASIECQTFASSTPLRDPAGNSLRIAEPTEWGLPSEINPGVEAEVNPRFNLWADDTTTRPDDHRVMTTTDYLINALFVLVVLRQTRERRLDVRSFVAPMVLALFVARIYVHSIPSAGNDLVLVGLLATAGLTLGVVSGFATHVRPGDGVALARVGWLAGGLLVAGISARTVFVFAVGHGAEPAIRGFSIAHQIGAAAWPLALVSMALCEVTARLVIVQLRGRSIVCAAAW